MPGAVGVFFWQEESLYRRAVNMGGGRSAPSSLAAARSVCRLLLLAFFGSAFVNS